MGTSGRDHGIRITDQRPLGDLWNSWIVTYKCRGSRRASLFGCFGFSVIGIKKKKRRQPPVPALPPTYYGRCQKSRWFVQCGEHAHSARSLSTVSSSPFHVEWTSWAVWVGRKGRADGRDTFISEWLTLLTSWLPSEFISVASSSGD
jgi:hypothetical protein